MKEEFKKYWLIAGIGFVLFLCIRYWDTFAAVLGIAFHAGIPLLAGCLIAYVVNILMSFYEKKLDGKCKKAGAAKWQRPLCITLAFLTLFVIIVLIFTLVMPEFINSIQLLILESRNGLMRLLESIDGGHELNQYLEWLDEGILQKSEDLEGTVTKVVNFLFNGVTGALGSLVTAATSLFSAATTLILGLIFSIYLLAGKEKLANQAGRILRAYCPKGRTRILHVLKTFNESYHNFIVAQCMDAMVLGGLCIIGMLIFRFPYAVMIGVLIGFTALIPIVGAFVGAGIGALMIFAVSPVKALLFVVFILVLQQIDNHFIYPKVVGQSIGLPGIWVLAAVTVGGGVSGIVGMLFAVPLFSAVYKLLREDVDDRNGQTEEKPALESSETENS